MSSAFTGMEYNSYVSSPSASPNNTIFSRGFSFDSNSDSSSPSSPHTNQLQFHKSMTYDAYPYSATPAHYHSTQETNTRIPVTLVSSSLDEKDRRRKRTDSTKSSDKETVPSMHLRRRAQNRASQRAFRERKEKHVKGLEHQLEELHEKHQDLLQSYSKQVDEVSRLNTKIAQLSAELSAVRHCQEASFNEVMIPERFDKFDAFPSSELMYQASDGFYPKGLDIGSDFPLYSLEDSL